MRIVRISALFVFTASTIVLSGAQAPQLPPAPSPSETSPFYAVVRNGTADDVRALTRTADVNAAERRGGATPLMLAAAFGSAAHVKALLDAGANVNAASYGRATALMWGVTDPEKVKLLLDKGADVNAVSELGHSAVWLAAMSDRSAATVRLLLAKGASVKAVDAQDQSTLLHAATFGNDTGTIRAVIDAGADVNATNIAGITPLMTAAANGNLEAVKLLLARGAKVNAVSGPPGATVKNGTIALGHFTALLLASSYGPNALVQALIGAGADVNAVDARGLTPLMLAVTADHGDPAIVKTLLAAGAKTGVKSGDGESAMDWAAKSGVSAHIAALKGAGAESVTRRAVSIPPAARADSPRAAAERGLAIIERSAGTFFVSGGCGACHAQNITDIAVGEAKRAGLRVDEAGLAQRLGGASAQFGSLATRLLERVDGPALDISMYMLADFAGAGHPPDRATDALVVNVTAQQSANGSWHRGFIARPPTADGDISITALGIRGLAVYGPPARRTELDERLRNAVRWLRGADVRNTEDHAYRLLGLRWGGVDAASLKTDAGKLLATQQADGGWSQHAGLGSDAYATGLAVYALSQAGVAKTDPALQRASQFLVNSQRADGSWHVASRSPKFQPYFESGFPYGHDQWISAWGTGWATTALAATLR